MVIIQYPAGVVICVAIYIQFIQSPAFLNVLLEPCLPTYQIGLTILQISLVTNVSTLGYCIGDDILISSGVKIDVIMLIDRGRLQINYQCVDIIAFSFIVVSFRCIGKLW